MHLNGIPEAFLHTSCATIKVFLVYMSVLHTFSTRKRQQKNKYVISRPWSVRIEKDFALSLECTDLAAPAREITSIYFLLMVWRHSFPKIRNEKMKRIFINQLTIKDFAVGVYSINLAFKEQLLK